MALPDTIGLTAGIAITWGSTVRTYALSPTRLRNDAGREGAQGDLAANWAGRHKVLFETKTASAPTDGNAVELYRCASATATAGSDNPGNLTGADAAVTAP